MNGEKIFRVSVIIPVYNAEKYLRKSVESAVFLPEIGEVILVEDKSPDNALKVCKELERDYEKVKLFRHPNGENRGAGASRNLGIEKATCEFIAFLDADDWYLPNRFIAEKKLFKEKCVDGVYSATGFFYHDTGLDKTKLTTLKKKIKPENLLFELVLGYNGVFHTNAITIRKEILKKTSLFNTDLKLHQDTHLWYRLAYFGRLLPGCIDEAVSVRRVHPNNRITQKNKYSKALFHQEVFKDFIKYRNVDKKTMRILFHRYIQASSSNLTGKVFNSIRQFIKTPNLILYYL